MNTKLKNNDRIKNAFDKLSDQLSDKDKLENDASLLMFRFLSIVEGKCKERGLNKKDLAKRLGVSASYISQIYNGSKFVNMITLAKIQKELDLKFEISEKKSYEETITDYTPISDGKGFWVYHKFELPDYDSKDKLPRLEASKTDKVA